MNAKLASVDTQVIDSVVVKFSAGSLIMTNPVVIGDYDATFECPTAPASPCIIQIEAGSELTAFSSTANKERVFSGLTLQNMCNGISVTGATRLTVSSCTFENIGWDGVEPTASQTWLDVNRCSQLSEAIDASTSDNVGILSNTIRDSLSGIRVQDSPEPVIDANTVTNCAGTAIELDASSGDGTTGCTSSTVSDNTLTGNRGRGVHVTGGLGTSITNNDIVDHWGSAVYLANTKNSVVTGNTLTSNNRQSTTTSNELSTAYACIVSIGTAGITFVDGDSVVTIENNNISNLYIGARTNSIAFEQRTHIEEPLLSAAYTSATFAAANTVNCGSGETCSGAWYLVFTDDPDVTNVPYSVAPAPATVNPVAPLDEEEEAAALSTGATVGIAAGGVVVVGVAATQTNILG